MNKIYRKNEIDNIFEGDQERERKSMILGFDALQNMMLGLEEPIERGCYL